MVVVGAVVVVVVLAPFKEAVGRLVERRRSGGWSFGRLRAVAQPSHNGRYPPHKGTAAAAAAVTAAATGHSQ